MIKRHSDLIIQIVLVIILAGAAIAMTVFSLMTVKPAEQFKAPVLVTYPPAALQTRSSAASQLVPPPVISRTPDYQPGTATLQLTFPPLATFTPSPELSMIPALERTQIPLFVTTIEFVTQQALLKEYVTGTLLAVEQTKIAAGPCKCYADLLNCSDFYTHTDAQLCMNYCIKLGFGDIHKLDVDKDGLACESR